MNLPFESSGGFHVQKNMFSAFWKLMVEIRASVRERAALPCDLDVLGAVWRPTHRFYHHPQLKWFQDMEKETLPASLDKQGKRVGNDRMKSFQAS